jgi:hypothetical protein
VFSTRKDAAEVREQVQNAHLKPDGTPLNLRDDLDDKHDVTYGALKHLTALVEGVIEDQRNDRDDRRTDRADLKHLSARVDKNTGYIRDIRRQLNTTTSEIHVIADSITTTHDQEGTP